MRKSKFLVFALCLFLGACGSSSDAAQGGLPNATPVAGSIPQTGLVNLVSNMTSTSVFTAVVTLSSVTVTVNDVFMACAQVRVSYLAGQQPTDNFYSAISNSGPATISIAGTGANSAAIVMALTYATTGHAGTGCFLFKVTSTGGGRGLAMRNSIGVTGGTIGNYFNDFQIFWFYRQ